MRDSRFGEEEEPIEAADAKSLTPGVTEARRKRPTGTRTGPSSTTRAPLGVLAAAASTTRGPPRLRSSYVGLFNRGPIVFQPQLFSLGQKRTALNSFLWKRNRAWLLCTQAHIQ